MLPHRQNSVFWPDFACHCFIIRGHMVERGEGGTSCQSNTLTGSHWSVAVWCHACQSQVCACMSACIWMCFFHHHYLLCVCALVLVIAVDLSITHSHRDPFANDRKGRRVYDEAYGGSERRRRIERIGEVRVTDVCTHFLLVCQSVFASCFIQKQKCGTAPWTLCSSLMWSVSVCMYMHTQQRLCVFWVVNC